MKVSVRGGDTDGDYSAVAVAEVPDVAALGGKETVGSIALLAVSEGRKRCGMGSLGCALSAVVRKVEDASVIDIQCGYQIGHCPPPNSLPVSTALATINNIAARKGVVVEQVDS